MSTTDAWLAEADDILDNWDGSPDAASWAADGSHEHDTTGDYYAIDRLPLGMSSAEASEGIRGLSAAMQRIHATPVRIQRRTAVVTLRVDLSGFRAALRQLVATVRGEPVPPMPRAHFTGTSREYRAARRLYARQTRAHRKATK